MVGPLQKYAEISTDLAYFAERDWHRAVEVVRENHRVEIAERPESLSTTCKHQYLLFCHVPKAVHVDYRVHIFVVRVQVELALVSHRLIIKNTVSTDSDTRIPILWFIT